MAERIPLFPLGTVLFPGALLPLRIFEERYRQLLADLLERPEPEQVFGVVAIREGREVGADGVRSLHEVGCTARLRLVEPTTDGSIHVVTAGVQRFRLLSLDPSAAPYPTARVDPLPEPLGECPPALADSVARLFLQYRAELLGLDAAVELPAAPGRLAYVVAASLLTGIADQQRLLAAPDVGARLRAEQALMRRERAIAANLPSVPGVHLTRSPPAPN
jgi:Lon protease-like protein